MEHLTLWVSSAIVLRTMLKMRLQRIGRKNNPSYRIVVTDSRNAPSRGRHVDYVGSYDPLLGRVQIDAEKAKHWLSNGVQPSDTVYNFLVSEKILEGKKRNALSRKSPIIDEAKLKAEAEAKAEREAKAMKEAEQALETPTTEDEVPEVSKDEVVA